ncbi:MAG TPA: 3-hydroxyacyl-ACP dehydratase FabZ [Gammaproteobacteria bacterium]|nr:3-hydroxyacyl-ACP dehydratase FabZ [Gammaproteobacteria bacterium]
MDGTGGFDIQRILELLPHRYPFLFVDRVLECVPGERLVAIKNVSIDEPFFVGHFPEKPVMPGALLLEAMAQTCSVLISITHAVTPGTLYYLVRVDRAKFRRPVEPGDQLLLSAAPRRRIRNMDCFDARAEVDGKLAAEAQIWCAPQKVVDST